MSFNIKENKDFKEKYLYTTLDSGFSVYIIPKDLPTSYAMVCCDFGNADRKYTLDGEEFTLPSGTAHFLEHKMFENADGSDAFLEFDRFGGNANAFTSFENTCYYFSCTENFFENLEILLKSVSSVNFTDESIEKEKKIIAREIMMYEDSPTSAMMRNLYKALYHNHPIVSPISGTLETISEITKETLFKAYNDFYIPSNMSLCVCGNIDAEKVLSFAKRYFSKQTHARPKTVFDTEPKSIKAERIESCAPIATPLYSIGIKCPPFEKQNLNAQRVGTAIRIAISLMLGRSSDFYCDNYEKGIINERFYAGYTQSRNSAHIVISGSGNDFDTVKRLVIHEIEKRKALPFTEQELLREKRAAYAECISLFDNGEDIVSAMSATAFLGYDEYDCIELIRDITSDEIMSALNTIDTNNCSLSVVNIKQGKETE
ncbi:MAG: insulinase family protein [Clostridia bacterium]|nr:insulinase family protein [Clostridia bacterium]